MSIRIMSQVFEKSKTRAEGRLVLLSLADNASDEGECYPSIATIARKANVSQPTTREYLHAFEKIGLITITGRAGADGKQTSNRYTIHVEKIGDDLITPELMASCRAPSKQDCPLSVLDAMPSKRVIPTPSKPLIPTPSKRVIDEPSVKPSIEHEEEDDDANLTPHQKAQRFAKIFETDLRLEALAPIRAEMEAYAARFSVAYFRAAVAKVAMSNGRSWNYLKAVLDNPNPAPRPTTARPEYRGKRVSTPAPKPGNVIIEQGKPAPAFDPASFFTHLPEGFNG